MATLPTLTRRADIRPHPYRPISRLDMAPLADVAFLLLSFFMMATQPVVLPLLMPSMAEELLIQVAL